MIKAYVYRLYPSKTQVQRLDSVRETCRRFYNDCLEERKTAYQERGETIGKYTQLQHVKEQKATNPWAVEVHSHVLQVVVADLDKAFQAFFRRVKAGETIGATGGQVDGRIDPALAMNYAAQRGAGNDARERRQTSYRHVVYSRRNGRF